MACSDHIHVTIDSIVSDLYGGQVNFTMNMPGSVHLILRVA